MNETSASPAETSAPAAPRSVLVWDVPVRIFHWLMVLCFAGAWLTAESEHWRVLHINLGYAMAALVVFRLIWGVAGSRYARFSSFVPRPSAVVRYVKSMLRGKPEHHTGHNPVGALAILAMLGLTAAVVATGWFNLNDVGARWMEEGHEGAAAIMLAVVGIHIAGVIVASWLHRENLVAAMVSGRKSIVLEPGQPPVQD